MLPGYCTQFMLELRVAMPFKKIIMMSLFLNRIFRSVKIDPEVFNEVKNDKNATLSAAIWSYYPVQQLALERYH